MRLFPLPLIPALVTVPTPGQLTQPLRAQEGGHSPGHWLSRDEDKDQGLARGYEEPEEGTEGFWGEQRKREQKEKDFIPICTSPPPANLLSRQRLLIHVLPHCCSVD
ncbi:hypothetical protein AOLI_G00297220 [Acnodon oligacanthus]